MQWVQRLPPSSSSLAPSRHRQPAHAPWASAGSPLQLGLAPHAAHAALHLMQQRGILGYSRLAVRHSTAQHAAHTREGAAGRGYAPVWGRQGWRGGAWAALAACLHSPPSPLQSAGQLQAIRVGRRGAPVQAAARQEDDDRNGKGAAGDGKAGGPRHVGLHVDHHGGRQDGAQVDGGVKPAEEAGQQRALRGLFLVKLVGAKRGDVWLDAAGAQGCARGGSAGSAGGRSASWRRRRRQHSPRRTAT